MGMRARGLAPAMSLALLACDGGYRPTPVVVVPDAGCMETPDAGVTGTAAVTFANNQGDLVGGTLGPCSTTDVRKPMEVVLLEAHPVFELGPGFALREAPGRGTLMTAVPVTYRGNDVRCFVKATGIEYLDAAGVAMAASDLVYATGSVGDVSGQWIDTCLGPNETGWLLDIVEDVDRRDLYRRTAKLVIDRMESFAPAAAAPASVMPERYTFAGGRLEVSVRSRGPQAATLQQTHFSRYLLFDDGGLPVSWGFVSDETVSAGVLAPDAVATIIEDGVVLPARGGRLRVFVEFHETAGADAVPAMVRTLRDEMASSRRLARAVYLGRP